MCDVRDVLFSSELYDKTKYIDSYYDQNTSNYRRGRLFVYLIEEKYGQLIEEYILSYGDCGTEINIKLCGNIDYDDRWELYDEICDYVWYECDPQIFSVFFQIVD